MKIDLLEEMRNGAKLTTGQQLKMIISLSIPAILAQISSVLMEYIDAAMVGQLGAGPAASIGLVAPLSWVFFGVISASATGYSVQVAQHIGGRDEKKARNILKNAAILALSFSFLVAGIGMSISSSVPGWLGGESAIQGDAFHYFFTFMCAMPVFLCVFLMSGMLRCSGNIRLPSIIHILICVFDVIFNFFLIFETRNVEILGLSMTVPGAGLGVLGAALGSVCAEACGGVLLFIALMGKKSVLRPRREEKFYWDKDAIIRAIKISTPIACEQVILNGALVVATAIIAPLGAVSLAANSLAVSAESMCYMPGFGVSEAATTIIGQSIGARRTDLTRRLAWMCIGLGVGMMAFMGAFMYIAAPLMFAILTPVAAIQVLGVRILRIEAFAEPLYGAAIVCTGALRGAGDTFVPSLLNLASMWGVRITLSLLLVDSMGLVGVWAAMATELCCRGCLFLIRVYKKDWSKAAITAKIEN